MSKGKGKYQKGKGAYHLEEEWFPDQNWYLPWEEPKEPEYEQQQQQQQQQQPQRLGMITGHRDTEWEPTGWETPPPRRTIRQVPAPSSSNPLPQCQPRPLRTPFHRALMGANASAAAQHDPC